MMRDRKKSSAGETRVESVQEFVEVVCACRDEWIGGAEYFDLWFRGQTHVSRKLQPTIFRYELIDSEDAIRDEFERRGPQYFSEPPPAQADYWDWYFLMQHYGAPTRLLDWTDSALVALFFALNSAPKNPKAKEDEKDKEDAVVWMLNPWWLNKRVLGDDALLRPGSERAKPYLAKTFERLDSERRTQIGPQYPVAIDPPFIARRVAVQRSHFTIFGWDREGLALLAREPDARLEKIVLAKEKAARMRADLVTLGVTDTSIYPDLHGLSDELLRFHLGNWPPD